MLQILTIQLTGQPLTQIQEITGKLAVGILRWVSKQWGKFNSGSNGYCTFPISFNSTCFNVTTCGKSGGAQNAGGSAGEFPPYNINLKGFYYSRWQCGSGNLVGSFWVSIGI